MNWLLRKALSYVFMEGEGGGGGGGAAAALATPPRTGAGGPAGGQPGGAATGATGAPGATGAGGPGSPWYDGFKDPDLKTWVSGVAGAYPDPESMASKAWHLEKLLGADKAGRAVIPPKPEAKPEEWQAFWKKVGGVPEKADGYALPKDIDPEVAKGLTADPMVGRFRDAAHKMGLPPQFFNGVMGFMAGELKSSVDAKDREFEQQIEREDREIRQEWGSNYDRNVELGRRAIRTYIEGDKDKQTEFLAKIEGAIGTKEMYKFFTRIGEGLGEHEFVSGEGAAGGGGLTPEGARLRIADLRKDADWSKRYLAGGADEKAEWERLHKIGYPDPAKGA